MSIDIEALKADAKKANAKATQAKMDLHDLSEELPTNWKRSSKWRRPRTTPT
jgi:hypothetical protein